MKADEQSKLSILYLHTCMFDHSENDSLARSPIIVGVDRILRSTTPKQRDLKKTIGMP
jgi:hypothetical protein